MDFIKKTILRFKINQEIKNLQKEKDLLTNLIVNIGYPPKMNDLLVKQSQINALIINLKAFKNKL